MKFTDLFIKRPVLAAVVSLLIFLIGLRALFSMQVRQYPKMENTTITVTTSYPGASSDVVQGFVTTPLQKSIASAEGIDYLTSDSTQGLSVISAYIKLNFDPNTAFTDVMAKVAQVRNQLPRDILDPVITKATGSTVSLMYIGFNSDELSSGQITDYLTRVVQPKLQTVFGVAQAKILGTQTFAMRVWLDPLKMAARNVSASDVSSALANNNFQAAAGTTKGEYVAFNVSAKTDLHDVEGFKQIIIKQNSDGSLVRLQDVAKVELGAESYDSSVIFDGKKAVFMGIDATPTANPLSVITDVNKVFAQLKQNFPPALHGAVVYDATKFIRSSIHEVVKTIVEATIIVIIVIYLFIGSIRSVFIPVVTIPLSLIGVCTFMLMLGYSINLLTLLAMVLAIGLVVDDAIVVVENVHRHIEEGAKPFDAAITGAREIATPVISMTITLAAVYAPIGFLGGITGSLFKEFAFTLASAVIVSGIIALTLSPMMCSKILSGKVEREHGFEGFLERNFVRLKDFYQERLDRVFNYRPIVVIFAVVVLVSCYFLYAGTTKELAPDEDQSVLFLAATGPAYANIDYMEKYTQQFNAIFRSFPETQNYFIINGQQNVNSSVAGAILKPWDERKRTQAQLNPILQSKMDAITGLRVAVFPLPSLPVSGFSLPVQFVINSTGDYPSLFDVSEKLKVAAMKSGLFMFVDNTLRFDQPQIDIEINRSKAAQMGIDMQQIAAALATAMGGNYINFFSVQGQSYKVIPQVSRAFRFNPDDIDHNYIKTASGDSIPLSTVVTLKQSITPNDRYQFQQLNGAILSGLMMPGHTIGEGLDFLREQANKTLPSGMTYDYAGQSRQFIQEGGALIFTFMFAIIIIFLVLAAQFESMRDPFIVLISVPMSICGALIPLYLGLASVNIYTQIGLITLIGLISKHGILMTDFANKLQMHEGLSIREAIKKAASIRLRPILMTTAAMVVGVVPLILASGAGAKSRFDIGLVIATGMMIGTLFTLFVVPTMYTFFAERKAVEPNKSNSVQD